MRRLKFSGLEMVLAVILGSVYAVSPAHAQDSKSKGDDPQAGSSNWFTDWFAPKEKSSATKKPAGKNKDAAKKSDPSAKSNKDKEEESMLLKREQAAYLRRLAVCDQLKEVAMRTNDFALSQKAERLEAQALAVYNQRIARLKASNAVYQPDQAALDIQPSSNSSRAGKTTTDVTQAREEKP